MRIIEGRVVWLRPYWMYFMGYLKAFRKASEQKWRLERMKHGDYSDDDAV